MILIKVGLCILGVACSCGCILVDVLRDGVNNAFSGGDGCSGEISRDILVLSCFVVQTLEDQILLGFCNFGAFLKHMVSRTTTKTGVDNVPILMMLQSHSVFLARLRSLPLCPLVVI